MASQRDLVEKALTEILRLHLGKQATYSSQLNVDYICCSHSVLPVLVSSSYIAFSSMMKSKQGQYLHWKLIHVFALT